MLSYNSLLQVVALFFNVIIKGYSFLVCCIESITHNNFFETEYKYGADPSITSAGMGYVSKEEIDVLFKQLAIYWTEICWVGRQTERFWGPAGRWIRVGWLAKGSLSALVAADV